MIKKTLYTLLFALILIPLIGIFNNELVYAEGNYKVKYIEDNGSLTEIDSFNDYDDAYNLMITNKDYVITHEDSLSYSKIISMNDGLVYSYPYRKKSNTLSIYEKLTSGYAADSKGASTYVYPYAEMTYHSTYVYFEAGLHSLDYGHGYVYVTLNGFEGYTDLEAVDLVPMKYIENELSFTLGGNARGNYANKSSYTLIPRQHYYYIKDDGNYTDLCLKYYEQYLYQNNEPASYAIRISVAPDFMEYDTKYYSDDGIHFYTDRNLSEDSYVGTYYNYHQFVPTRTYSNIKASTINAYIKKGSNNSGCMLNTGDDFINNQNIYGVNAAIVAAMGVHESGYGTSNISNGKNNLFGWAAYDANTGAASSYESVSDCIAAQMGDNLANYLDVNCYCYFSMSLGNKGGGFITKYASDPYWAEQIAAHYYAMDKRDNDFNGKLTDYDTYSLALVNTCSDIKAQADTNSTTLYKTCNKTGYQENVIVTVLKVENGFALTQLSNPIIDNEVIYPYSLSKGTRVTYDADASKGYIALSNLTYINGNKVDNTVDESKLSLVTSIRQISLNENGLTIKGVGAISGLNFTSKVGVKHELVLINYSDNSETNILLDTVDSSGFSLNDNYDYTYTGFEKTISLDNFTNGSYGLMLKVSNGSYNYKSYLLCAIKNYNNLSIEKSDITYHLTCNQLYGYRVELDVSSSPLDYSSISKASMRKSLLTLEKDTISLDEEGNFTIGGHGFMYYLNYSESSNVKYTVYLINNKNNYKALNTSTIDKSEDQYAVLLGLDYNLDNIGFLANDNIADLEKGEYQIIVENTLSDNGNYKDILELTNNVNATLFENVSVNNKSYSLRKDNVRNRLILTVE